jgi:hypothetical protein
MYDELTNLLMEAFIAEDGHDTWNNLAFYSSSAAVFDPLIKQVVIVEELSDDEVRTSFYLLL